MEDEFDKEYIVKVLTTSKSKVEIAKKLNIQYNKINGTKLNKIIKEYEDFAGCKVDTSLKNKYDKKPKRCECCGRELPFEKRKNKFCSLNCSATYNNTHRTMTDEGIEKMRITLRNNIKKLNDKNDKLIKQHLKPAPIHTRKQYCRICVICGNEFIPPLLKNGNVSKRQTCSDECCKINRHNVGVQTHEKCIKNGTFVGWKTRNILSYAEKFFINVLNNNGIEYEREKYIHGPGYFLDFVVTNNECTIDLEIDGKEHDYPERKLSDAIRDEYLINHGYYVYRIRWNEINTQHGKDEMKEKIEKFLHFYYQVGLHD